MAEIWTALNQNSRFVHIFTKSCKREKLQPERLLRALLLQAFYTTRSETQLIEQLDYNLLYRWFVGLGVDEHGSSVLGLRFTFVSPIVQFGFMLASLGLLAQLREPARGLERRRRPAPERGPETSQPCPRDTREMSGLFTTSCGSPRVRACPHQSAAATR
jgi:hypothetical protein